MCDVCLFMHTFIVHFLDATFINIFTSNFKLLYIKSISFSLRYMLSFFSVLHQEEK